LEGPWYWLDKCPAPKKIYNKRKHLPKLTPSDTSYFFHTPYTNRSYVETLIDTSGDSPDPEYRVYFVDDIVKELFEHYQDNCVRSEREEEEDDEEEEEEEEEEEGDEDDSTGEEEAPTFNPTFSGVVTKKIEPYRSVKTDTGFVFQSAASFLVDFDVSGKSIWQCYKAICLTFRGGMYVNQNHELVFDNYQGDPGPLSYVEQKNIPIKLNPSAQIVSRNIVKDKEYPEIISAKYVGTRFRTQSGESDSFLDRSPGAPTQNSIYSDADSIYHYPTAYETTNYAPPDSTGSEGRRGHRFSWSPEDQGDKYTFPKVTITVPYTQKPFLYGRDFTLSELELSTSNEQFSSSVPGINDGAVNTAVFNYSVLLLAPREIVVSVSDFPLYYDRPLKAAIHCQKDYLECIADTRIDTEQYTIVDCEEEKKELVREVWYFKKELFTTFGGGSRIQPQGGEIVTLYYPHDKETVRNVIALDTFCSSSPFTVRATEEETETRNIQPSEGYCIQVGNKFFEIPVTTMAVVELQDIDYSENVTEDELIFTRGNYQKGIVRVAWNLISTKEYDIQTLQGIPCLMYFPRNAINYLRGDVSFFPEDPPGAPQRRQKRNMFLCILTSSGRKEFFGNYATGPDKQDYPYEGAGGMVFGTGTTLTELPLQWATGVELPPPSFFAHVIDPPSSTDIDCDEVLACINVCDAFKDCFDDEEFEDFFCEKVKGCLGIDPEDDICDAIEQCDFDEKIDERLQELCNTITVMTDGQVQGTDIVFDRADICYVQCPQCEPEPAQPVIIEGTDCADPDPVMLPQTTVSITDLMQKLAFLEQKIKRLESK
jgi:hypothetical protein